MMQKTVATGYTATSTFSQRLRIMGMSTSAHHVDQPVCIDGIAAYWLDRSATAPLSNDQSPPYLASVSTTPYPWQSTTWASWQAPSLARSPAHPRGTNEER